MLVDCTSPKSHTKKYVENTDSTAFFELKYIKENDLSKFFSINIEEEIIQKCKIF